MSQPTDRTASASVSVNRAMAIAACTVSLVWIVLVPAEAYAFGAPPRAGWPRPAAVLAATVWACVFAYGCARRRRIVVPLALFGLALYAGLLVAASSLLPDGQVGDGTSWVFVGGSISLVLGAAVLRWPAATAAVTVMIGTYLGGVLIAPVGVPRLAYLLTAVGYAVQAACGFVAGAELRHSAVVMDAILARRVRMTSAARAAAGTGRHLRQALRRRVAAALAAVTAGAADEDPAARRARCGQALDEVTIAASATTPGTVAPALALRRMTDEARQTGIHVQWEVTVEAVDVVRKRRLRLAGTVDDHLHQVPPRVVGMVVAALHTIFLDVHHLGGNARTDVIGTVGPHEVDLVVSSPALRFTPHAQPHQPGDISDVLAAYMADVGGWADTRSDPNTGMLAHLHWPHGPAATSAQPTTVPGTLVTAMLSGRYRDTMFRVLLVITALWHAASLIFLLSHPQDYQSVLVALVCWVVAGLAATILVLGARHRLADGHPWFVAGVIAACSVWLILTCRGRGGLLGFANWPLGDAGWLVALLVARRPVRSAVIAVACLNALDGLLTVARAGWQSTGLVKVVSVGVAASMFQLTVLLTCWALQRLATTAGQELAAADRILDRVPVLGVADVIGSRTQRLLAALADGSADLADPHVRELADQLSGRLTEPRTTPPDDAGRALNQIRQAASRAGIELEIQGAQFYGNLGPALREALLDLCTAALAAASTGPALLTICATDQASPGGLAAALLLPINEPAARHLADATGFGARPPAQLQALTGLRMDRATGLVADQAAPNTIPAAWFALTVDT